jgi:hypothetical protein
MKNALTSPAPASQDNLRRMTAAFHIFVCGWMRGADVLAAAISSQQGLRGTVPAGFVAKVWCGGRDYSAKRMTS